MPNKANSRLTLVIVLATAGIAAAWGQQSGSGPELSARDMFRKAAGRLVPAQTAAVDKGSTAQAERPVKKATEVAKADPPPPTTKPNPPAKKTPPPDPVVASKQPNKQPGKPQRPVGDAGEAQVVRVSTQAGGQVPLGLRYSILKDTGGGSTAEVDSATVFRSGDRIRLSVETNDTAYVYIVLKGSSGNWRVLFPSAEIGNGNNQVQPGHQYTIPARHWFAFDEQVGEENLFVMVSRQPEKDLESLIYKLHESGTDTAPAKDSALLMAANIPPIDDALISRLRNEVYARDLVFEKVDDNSSEAKAEKAVYVVNKTGDDNSRVIADVKLQHH